LRLPNRRDAAALAAFYVENREFLQPFAPVFSPELFSEKGWRGRIDATLAEYRSGRGLRLILVPKGATGRIVGVANFTSITSFPGYLCNLGYSMAEAEQGKGLMTEALRAAIAYVFSELNLHRIEANYMPRNEASGRVLEKLGFQIEGHAGEYLLINGRWEAHVRTSLTNPDWRGASQ
jgi:ribosomal-protein-alanine N-acetyltransferase